MIPQRTSDHQGVEETLSQYFEEIDRIPLLTREEEVALARRMRQGDPEAFEALVDSSLRFVVSVAKRYQGLGLSLADLISEGNVGLVRAAHKFDETRGVKFISYAVWWIRQAILEALAKQSMIARLPLNQSRRLSAIFRESGLLMQELGREPTAREIALRVGVNLEELERVLNVTQPYLPIDEPVGPKDGNPLGDYIPDEGEHGPEEEANRHLLTEMVQQSLARLPEREARILRLYYGLDGEPPMTLEEIGRIFGITRERVRQLKEAALMRLRHPSRRKALEVFLT